MSEETLTRAMEAAAAELAVPGFVAAAHWDDGRVYCGAFGVRSTAAPAPMTPDTVFWIASMTKLVTTTAALRLIAEGALDLETPVAALVPRFADLPLLDGHDERGAPRLRKAPDAPSVRHLLTHTSGLGYGFTDPELARYARDQSIGGLEADRLPRRFEAGARWLYGVNTDWLGEVIAAVSGERLDQHLTRTLFAPLGMADTDFAVAAEARERLAAVHMRLPDGGLTPTAFSLPPPPHFMMGGAGLYSTAPDYLRFLDALMEPGRLLPAPLLDALFTGAVGDLKCGDLVSADPTLARDFRPLGSTPKTWSLGLLVNRAPGPDGRAEGSGAWAGLGNCYYWIDRKRGVRAVVLSQILPFADPAALDLAARFERAVYA